MILKTPRLILRPFVVEDTAGFNKFAMDPQVTEYLTWESHISMEQTLNSVKTRFIDNPNVYCIELANIKTCIGCIDIRVDEKHNKAGFGYVLNRSYWNNGYMSEALTVILKHIFNFMKINKVESSHYRGNESSGRVMMKCGMVLEGTQKESLIIKGKPVDVFSYGITKRDFDDINTPLINKIDNVLDEILR